MTALPADLHRFDDFGLLQLIQKPFHRFGRRNDLDCLPALAQGAFAAVHITHPLIDTVLAGPLAERHPE